MKKAVNNSFFFILIILFLTLFQITETLSVNQSEGPNQNCLLIKNNTLYDLYELSKNDSKEMLTNKNTTVNGIIRVNYALCKNVNGSSSVVGYNSENSTFIIAGSVNGEVGNKNKMVENEKKDGVTIILPKGQSCGSGNYTFKIILKCFNYTTVDFGDEYLSNSGCDFTLEANSKYACGQKEHYFEPKGSLLMIIGIILCILGNILGILGYKFLNIAFLLSCIIAFPILIRFALINWFDIKDGLVSYILMGVGFIIGAIIAIILLKKHKFIKVYMSILGGITGFLIGIFLCDILMTIIQTSHQHTLRTVIIIIFIIIGIVLGIFLSRKVCIFGTSVLGAYAFMKGISFFLYDIIEYIDEEKVYDYSRTGNFEQIKELIKGKFFIYPLLWVVFTIAYLITQHKINPKVDDCEDYKELEGKFGSVFGQVRIDTDGSNEPSIRDERIMEDF